ncbi:BA75_03959T0 [Komagataella pastoris]|uniref:BA75_03959T0 n=1 Tax=Komagataella pastoris TaxID=4922 RepID=A0A1B2JEV4_PICPA|nr:BA75_03959T0 [Komagataella pastoris]
MPQRTSRTLNFNSGVKPNLISTTTLHSSMLILLKLLSILICLRHVIALTYMGCYPSSLLEQSFIFQSSTSLQTIELCSGTCSGHLYAALINGTECYCSDSFVVESERSFECEVRCAGNIIQTCGGTFSFQVFLHEELTNSISPSASTTGYPSSTFPYDSNDTSTISSGSYQVSEGSSTLATTAGVQNFTFSLSSSSSPQTFFSWNTLANITSSSEDSSEWSDTPSIQSQVAETVAPAAPAAPAANEATQVNTLDTSSDEFESSSQFIPTPSPSSATASYIEDSRRVLSTGAIVGISVGCSSLLVLFVVICYFVRRRRNIKSAQLPEDESSVAERDDYVSEFVRNYVQNYHENGSVLSSSSQSVIYSVDTNSTGPFGSGQVRRFDQDENFEEERDVLRIMNPDNTSENTFSTT